MSQPVELLHYPAVDTHLIASKHVRQIFKIEVMLPACGRAELTRFPVVYATDGNRSFDMFKGLSHLIQPIEREDSRFILVGIGYPGDSPLAGGILRARDFTFPGYIQHSLQPPPVEGVLVVPKGEKNFFGAEDFQRFIGRELIPFIDERYRTLPGERTYFGHSAGGGFGLFTMFTQTQLFNRYVISSPGVSYHGRSSAGIEYDNHDVLLQYARAFIDAGKTLEGIRVYLSVGSEEDAEPDLAQWRLTSNVHRMAALLKAIPGLYLMTKVFAGEKHMTVWPVAFMHGVRAALDADEVRVVLETEAGCIEIVVDMNRAPLSSKAFLSFVDDGRFAAEGGFYRTVRSRENDRGNPAIDVIQGGLFDPPASLATVEHEPTRHTGLLHRDGTVSLARGALGTTTGAGFFICVGDQPALDAGGTRNSDGEGFAAFGRVVRGMETVCSIHCMPTNGQMLRTPVRIRATRRLLNNE